MNLAPLQIQILKLLAREGRAGFLRMEDHLDWKTPSQLRRLLGELIVLGLVEQAVHHDLGGMVTYNLMPRGAEEAAKHRRWHDVLQGGAA